MKLALVASIAFFCTPSPAIQEVSSSVPVEGMQQAALPAFDLIGAQCADGSWSALDVPQGVPGVHAGVAQDDLWVTSAAVFSVLGEGSTSAAGPYQSTVRSALGWIEGLQEEDGRLVSPGAETDLLVHALATLVLTEHRVLAGEAGADSTAQKAVAYLEARALESGGWNREGSASGEPDPRTTAWACMAIASAKDGGIESEQGRLADAAASLVALHKTIQDPTDLALACELLSRLLAGESAKKDGFRARSQQLVERAIDSTADGVGHNPEEFYLRSLVAYQSGGEVWKTWLGPLGGQTKKFGYKNNSHLEFMACDPQEAHGGSVAACGFSVLTLQIYFKYARVIGTR